VAFLKVTTQTARKAQLLISRLYVLPWYGWFDRLKRRPADSWVTLNLLG
jgi:hypothetical protein